MLQFEFSKWNEGTGDGWLTIKQEFEGDGDWIFLTVEDARSLCLEILNRAFTAEAAKKILTEIAERNATIPLERS